jgi:hypothetical protein
VSRGLTTGEVDLVRSMFGRAIAFEPVRLYQKRWWWFQPRRIVMAPDGNLWFPPKCPHWSEDFAQEHMSLRALFIHEMTHVWQHQSGMNLILKRGLFARYTYDDLGNGKTFHAYGVEQQAEIMRHYFLRTHGWTAPGAASLETYQNTVPFRREPAWQRHPRLVLS